MSPAPKKTKKGPKKQEPIAPPISPKRLERTLLLLGKSWPFLAITIAHFIWGANFVVAKLALEEFPLMSLAFLRFVLAIVFLLPFLIAAGPKNKLQREDLPKLFAIGVLMVGLNIAFFYAGLIRTTAINASALTMTVPILTVLGAWIFLREKVYVVNIIGVLAGLLGTLVILGIPLLLLGTSFDPETTLGNILIILASVAWVVGALISKDVLQRYSTLTVTAVIFIVGIILFALPAVSEYIQDPEWINKVTYLGVLGLLYVSILSSVSAYFLFEWSVKKIGVVKSDLFQYLEPVVAILLAVLVLGEQPRFSLLIGIVLVGLGVYWGTLGRDHHKAHKSHRV